MQKVIDRWNTFSRVGKGILIFIVTTQLLFTFGMYAMFTNRINIAEKTYSISTIDHPRYEAARFEFTKNGEFKGTTKYEPTVYKLKYKFDQKSITVFDKVDKEVQMHFTDLKKKSDGTILATYRVKDSKTAVKMKFTPIDK
ncbi:hypothetical protein [Companilactobacillus ginsenosidimutans]|uniref:Uncharacterized protein n=1 Tax=Companilactobacillus ginsenosidimutans TaxID=1007676 RepID=A0A0H4QFT0_9LACO|nr:hypothetical protein [Companilactobacillus ginsenosidimutans]AKP67274.1 hypothetical protein ABM34_06790 [Companilactobacillus ginsenosidimutans]